MASLLPYGLACETCPGFQRAECRSFGRSRNNWEKLPLITTCMFSMSLDHEKTTNDVEFLHLAEKHPEMLVGRRVA